MTSAFGGQHSIQLSYGRVVRGRNDKGSDHGKASAVRLCPVSSWRNRALSRRQAPLRGRSRPSPAMACTVAGRMIAIGAGNMLSRIAMNS